ncbi:MAG: cytochrome b/b6 domain-containing protein, partial [Acidobacteriota bacterium]
MTDYAVRFSKKQRIEHFVVMTTFVLLALTGFPQKFYEAGAARFLVKIFGGLDGARLVHRISGFLFAALTFFHLSAAILSTLQHKM